MSGAGSDSGGGPQKENGTSPTRRARLLAYLSRPFVVLGRGIKRFFIALSRFFRSLAGALKKAILTVCSWIVRPFKWLKREIQRALCSVKNWFARKFSWIGKGIKRIFRMLWRPIARVLNKIGNILNRIKRFFVTLRVCIYLPFNWFGSKIRRITSNLFRFPRRGKRKPKITLEGGESETVSRFKTIFSSNQDELKRRIPLCTKPQNLDIIASGGVKCANVNCHGCYFPSNLSDPKCRLQMVKVVGDNYCNKLVLNDSYYKKEYDVGMVGMLQEIYEIAEMLRFNRSEQCGLCARLLGEKVERFKEIIRRDPVRVATGNPRIRKDPKIRVDGIPVEQCEECQNKIQRMLYLAKEKLRGSSLVNQMLGNNANDYGAILRPLIRPFLSDSRVYLQPPQNSVVVESYEVSNSRATIYSNNELGELYFIHPPEYDLSLTQLQVLKEAYEKLTEEAPNIIGSSDNTQFEKHFRKLSKSVIAKAATKANLEIREDELKTLVEILTRCTLGLDIIELFLKDPSLQDVYINSPVDNTPIYVKHKDYDDCRTNVFITDQMAKNFISKFRLKSGRAFSEVSPILDMDLPEFGVRVNITGPPVSPDGLAFAFRRGGETPWTLLKFIENNMISPLAAGLLSFMVNEESTVLLCGDRGSGKTSMLTALMGAMPTRYRILTIEDTFEIPVTALASEGFRIQRMKVKPPTNTKQSFEVSADEALRSLLRMGDSAIVMGEVRGQEAKTLYEAMNVGGSGNCVLGTIHGKSPRHLLERVISSLGVPPQSFKATDLVVLADRIRPHGGTKKFRRVTEIVEVRKSWREPNPDSVFKKLMVYSPGRDMLEPTENLEKSEVLRAIAYRRGVTLHDVLDDIKTRSKIYEYVVSRYKELGDKELLEAKTMVEISRSYTTLLDSEIKKYGRVDYNSVLQKFKKWFYARTHATHGQEYSITIASEDELQELHETM